MITKGFVTNSIMTKGFGFNTILNAVASFIVTSRIFNILVINSAIFR